ncbi:hypothetical protein GCM10008090_32680 [Arenicella chitinivorans]|uniref:DUF4097 domain-containing protein n=1 Tax=Arenicella chitinivorans TaxID=1329800 RepID=A0A918S4I3_9GAMM|nr:DUF4097 family beta strand repeat-containing protein [Arenicella chitinivorans]GHA20206.1 hypothetical protein GCM10008090_32680 [Arenicella chitinivorans]
MKTLLTLVLLATTSVAQAERIDRTLDVDPTGLIRTEIIDGKVLVEGWNKPQIRVTGDVDNARDFVFKTDGDETLIETESKGGFWGGNNRGGHAKLTIYVPRQSALLLEGVSTSFAIIKVDGPVNTSTMSGDISLDGGKGKVKLESVSGDIDIVNATGDVSVSSVSGDIKARVDASDFEAQTVSGDIEGEIGKSEHVELNSVSGDIEVSLALINGGELDADTVSGDIDITFANQGDLHASFEIETGPGGQVKNRITDDKTTSFMSLSGSLQFKLGRGESEIDLETMSGTITIDR